MLLSLPPKRGPFRRSLTVLALAAMSGCHPTRISQPSLSSPPSPPVVSASVRGNATSEREWEGAVETVQALPGYHRAQQACRRGAYRQASALLSKIEASADLSPLQRRFCRQQQQICREHLTRSIAPVASTPVPPTSPSSQDCGPRALLLACRSLGVAASLPALTRAAHTDANGASLAGLAEAARSVGLQAEGVQVSREALADISLPALAWVHQNHFVAVLALHGRGEAGAVTFHDPNASKPQTVSRERLLQDCGGYMLLLRR